MEPIYQQTFPITDNCVDCHGRLKPSTLLYFIQEVAGNHFNRLSMPYEALANRGLFWAIIRQRVQITRMPCRGEAIRLETWPMPTTRTAYPRSVIAYDEQGKEVFRSVSLWVLMDLQSRSMVLPGKSGIDVSGLLRGNELALPGSLIPKPLSNHRSRQVCFTDLDRNGHMNNTRYLDWICDLLPSAFHREHPVTAFTLCYLSEAREGQPLCLSWDFLEDGCLNVDAHRETEEKSQRVFAAKLFFG